MRKILATISTIIPDWPWPTILPLIFGVISLIMGVVSWQIPASQDLGYYFAFYGLGIALAVFLPSIIFFHQKSRAIANELNAMIRGADIESVKDKEMLVKNLVGSCASIEVYGDTDLLYRIVQATKVRIGKHIECDIFAYAAPPKTMKSWNANSWILASPVPIQAVFFVSQLGVASGVLLFPSGVDQLERGWVHLSYQKVLNRMRVAYREGMRENAVALKGSSSPSFTASAVADFLEEFTADWRQFPKSHGRLCRFGKEVATVQRALTDQATKVDAIDMSSIDIWLPDGRIFDVAMSNAAMIKRGGEARRVFLVESEATLAQDAEHKQKVATVLTLQSGLGIHVGLAFKDMIPPEDIQDFAIYTLADGRAAWIETLRRPSDAEGTLGFFTASLDTITKFQKIFDRVWGGQKPIENARKLIEEHKKQTASKPDNKS